MLFYQKVRINEIYSGQCRLLPAVNLCFFQAIFPQLQKYFEVRNNIQIIHNKNLIWSNIAYTNFINYIIKNICSISQHQKFLESKWVRITIRKAALKISMDYYKPSQSKKRSIRARGPSFQTATVSLVTQISVNPVST